MMPSPKALRALAIAPSSVILTPLASLTDDICFLTWIWRMNFSSLERRSCFLLLLSKLDMSSCFIVGVSECFHT